MPEVEGNEEVMPPIQEPPGPDPVDWDFVTMIDELEESGRFLIDKMSKDPDVNKPQLNEASRNFAQALARFRAAIK